MSLEVVVIKESRRVRISDDRDVLPALNTLYLTLGDFVGDCKARTLITNIWKAGRQVCFCGDVRGKGEGTFRAVSQNFTEVGHTRCGVTAIHISSVGTVSTV